MSNDKKMIVAAVVGSIGVICITIVGILQMLGYIK